MRSPGTRLRCFGTAQSSRKLNGGTIHTFREEKIAKLLPKSIARTARIQFEKWHLLFREYLRDWTSPHVHIYLYLRGEEVRSSAGNEEEKVFGARFSRQENSHFRKKQYRHLRLIFSWRKEKKIVRLFEAIRWLVLRPWDKSNAKGIRKWTKRDTNSSPGTNRRKLSYASVGYLCMQSKGYATIES